MKCFRIIFCLHLLRIRIYAQKIVNSLHQHPLFHQRSLNIGSRGVASEWVVVRQNRWMLRCSNSGCSTAWRPLRHTKRRSVWRDKSRPRGMIALINRKRPVCNSSSHIGHYNKTIFADTYIHINCIGSIQMHNT